MIRNPGNVSHGVQRRNAGGGLGQVAPSRSERVQGRSPCRTHWVPMLKCALGPFRPAGVVPPTQEMAQ